MQSEYSQGMEEGMSEMSIGMHVHDKTRRYRSTIGEADNIATIQASTVAQQVHATRAREAQARSAQTHAGAFGCMWGGERERGCRRR